MRGVSAEKGITGGCVFTENITKLLNNLVKCKGKGKKEGKKEKEGTSERGEASGRKEAEPLVLAPLRSASVPKGRAER